MSSEPTKPLAPVTSIRIAPDDDAKDVLSRNRPHFAGCSKHSSQESDPSPAKRVLQPFCLRFAECDHPGRSARCFDRTASTTSTLSRGGSSIVQSKQGTRTPKGAHRKASCESCFFRVNMLCALDLGEPCATFRPHEAQLRPPHQLRFVFRQERRARAAWSFPSAQEQAALHR